MDEQLKNNLTSGKLWLRMGYMILVAFLLHIASFAVGILVIIQCAIKLITGATNQKLKNFSLSLITFIHQGLSFIIFHSESKPFPFNDWPEPLPSETFATEAESQSEQDESIEVVPTVDPGLGEPTMNIAESEPEAKTEALVTAEDVITENILATKDEQLKEPPTLETPLREGEDAEFGDEPPKKNSESETPVEQSESLSSDTVQKDHDPEEKTSKEH